jgi:3-hydroxyacyl-[acyl-carrier-protein] dehydratase
MATRETTFEVRADHPAFDGHFPGRPILPGVALVAEAMAALERSTGTEARDWILESAKFACPVAPGTRLAIIHRDESPRRVRFEIRSENGLVASGSFARRPASPS